mgnify:CR=1 FL=1
MEAANHIFLPEVHWIEKEDLQKKIKKLKRVVVYHSLKGCPDCARLDLRVLMPYFGKRKPSEPLFRIETYPWRQYKNNPDPKLAQKWLDYIDCFQLSFVYHQAQNVKHEDEQFSSARIPTLQVWEDGKLIDMLVYYNDRFSLTDWPKTIIGSFYQDGPIGQRYSAAYEYADDVNIHRFHRSKVVDFLDKYLR